MAFGEKFVADDDFMKGLTISIKNRSNKRILLAVFDFFFPPPPNSQSKLSVFRLADGNFGLLWDHSPTEAERLVGIAPGEKADIACVGREYDNFQKFYDAIGRPNVERLDLRLRTLVFEDDTMWDLGDYFRRNPDKPDKWLALEQPPRQSLNPRTIPGRARTRSSAVCFCGKIQITTASQNRMSFIHCLGWVSSRLISITRCRNEQMSTATTFGIERRSRTRVARNWAAGPGTCFSCGLAKKTHSQVKSRTPAAPQPARGRFSDRLR